MHNYEKNIHIGDVESKRRAMNGEDEVQEICEVVEKYTMHNYKQNIHIGDVKSIKSKRRAVNGEDEVQEICEVVEENGIPMKIVL